MNNKKRKKFGITFNANTDFELENVFAYRTFRRCYEERKFAVVVHVVISYLKKWSRKRGKICAPEREIAFYKSISVHTSNCC